MKENKTLLSIEFSCLLRFFLKNIWLLLLALIIGVGGTELAISLHWQPTYTSSATYVVMSRSGAASASLNQSAANDAATMLSDIIVSEVMENKLKSAIGDEAESGTLSATVIGDTDMLVVTCKAKSPRDAYVCLSTAMDYFDEYFASVDGNYVLHILSDARIPVQADGSISTLRYLVLGGGGAVILMLVIMFLLFLKRDTVQNRYGASAKLDAEMLVLLPHEKRDTLIGKQNVSFTFRENIYKLRSRMKALASERKGGSGAAVILVTSTVANEGKSTIAANLALALAEMDSGVLLMDMDFRNPSLLSILGERFQPARGLAELLRNDNITAKDILATIKIDKQTKLMTMLEKKRSTDVVKLLGSERTAKLLSALRRTMKYIVIDAPPAGIFPDGNILSDLADFSVLVVRQDVVSACDINDIADSLRQGKGTLAGFVLNDMRGSGSGVYGYGYGYGYGHGYGYGYGHYYGKKGYGYGYGYGYGESRHSSSRKKAAKNG